jgi:mono/diheme cytochrome c family protein
MRVTRLLLCLAILAVLGAMTLAGCGDDEATTTTAAVGTDTTVVEGEPDGGTETDGEAVFANTCAGCHGEGGTGASAPDLTALDLEKERVEDQVRNGGGAMPAYGDRLSDEEIDAVSTYVTEDLMQ